MYQLEDLRREHDEVGIGPLIDAAVRRLAAEVASGYPPTIYARTSGWTADAIEDLVQDVHSEWLLGQGQLTYILAAARTDAEFRALTVRTIKRALAHRRVRSVVDNLLDRCRSLLAQEPFETQDVGGRSVYCRRGAGPYRGEPRETELRDAELRVATIPRLLAPDGERASAVYATPDLIALLLAVAESIPGGFSVADLDRIFRRVLTPWLASSLVSDEGLRATPSPDLTPEDRMIVSDITANLLAALTIDQKQLLRLYLANAKDVEIAAALGLRARQTVLKRRAEVARVLAEHLDELPSPLADTVVGGLATALTAERDSRA
jgi:hypothetical protein